MFLVPNTFSTTVLTLFHFLSLFHFSTALRKWYANEQLLHQQVQSFGYGSPMRYLDGTAFLRRMSVAETEKELDRTLNGNNISILTDWKHVPEASFSSSGIFSLLIFIEKHLYGHTVQNAFMEHETVSYSILKCWLPLYFIYSFMLSRNTGGERMDR